MSTGSPPIETVSPTADKAKLAAAVLLVVAGVAAYYLIKQADWVRWVALVALLLLAVAVFFTAEIYVLSQEEGGRHTPFFNNYRPQFYFRTTDVTGAVELPTDKEMVMPGDNVSITVKLINPIAMEEGLRFAIREGGRTVGAGVVAKIIA